MEEKTSRVREDSRYQSEALRFAAQGFTNKEIAALMGIHLKSAETYKSRTKRKLDLHTRSDIISYALDQGWLHDEVIIR